MRAAVTLPVSESFIEDFYFEGSCVVFMCASWFDGPDRISLSKFIPKETAQLLLCFTCPPGWLMISEVTFWALAVWVSSSLLFVDRSAYRSSLRHKFVRWHHGKAPKTLSWFFFHDWLIIHRRIGTEFLGRAQILWVFSVFWCWSQTDLLTVTETCFSTFIQRSQKSVNTESNCEQRLNFWLSQSQTG